MNPDLIVTGGVGGVAARYDDMHTAAAALSAAGDALDTLGRSVLNLLDDPDLLASALLCPGGAVAAELQLISAVAGPHGLVAVVVDIRLTSLRLEAAADLYVAREEALADLVTARGQLMGQCLAGAALVTAPVVAVGAAVVAVGAALGEAHIFVAGSAVALVTSRDADTVRDEYRAHIKGQVEDLLIDPVIDPLTDLVGDSVEDLVVEYPWIVDEVAGSLPYAVGALLAVPPGLDSAYEAATGRSASPRTVPELVAMITPFLAVGRGRAISVASAGFPASPPAPVSPGVAGLLSGVQRRSEESDRARQALIGVRKISAGSGRPRAWVVELPGTKEWGLQAGSNPADTTSNLQLVAESTSAYQQAVVHALRGRVRPGEPVMLVGHSQGGLTAAALAADPTVRKQFNITHVITAGSPIAGIEVPPDVQVLSLENERDPVPRLDAAPNAPTAAHTSVVFDLRRESLGEHHELDAYRAGAEAVDAATDHPSLDAFSDSAKVFFPGDVPAVLHRYQLRREFD